MTLSHDDISALFVTAKLACITTVVLLLVGTPLAWWLATTRWRLRFLVEAVVALPLILPPTVLGFYLLIALGPKGPVGWFGNGTLAFSFTGLVVGSVIYSLPFVVQPLQNAFQSIGAAPLENAAILGASPWDRFRSVVMPLSRPAFITASVLGFAHTVGEFGVVLMIGGNIPGETRVLSIAIYDHVDSLEYGAANSVALLLLIGSLLLLIPLYAFTRRARFLT